MTMFFTLSLSHLVCELLQLFPNMFHRLLEHPTQSILYDFARTIFLDHNIVHMTSSDEKSSGDPHYWQDAVQL